MHLSLIHILDEAKIRAKANVSQQEASDNEEKVTEADAVKALGIKHSMFGYSKMCIRDSGHIAKPINADVILENLDQIFGR